MGADESYHSTDSHGNQYDTSTVATAAAMLKIISKFSFNTSSGSEWTCKQKEMNLETECCAACLQHESKESIQFHKFRPSHFFPMINCYECMSHDSSHQTMLHGVTEVL